MAPALLGLEMKGKGIERPPDVAAVDKTFKKAARARGTRRPG